MNLIIIISSVFLIKSCRCHSNKFITIYITRSCNIRLFENLFCILIISYVQCFVSILSGSSLTIILKLSLTKDTSSYLSSLPLLNFHRCFLYILYLTSLDLVHAWVFEVPSYIVSRFLLLFLCS